MTMPPGVPSASSTRHRSQATSSARRCFAPCRPTSSCTVKIDADRRVRPRRSRRRAAPSRSPRQAPPGRRRRGSWGRPSGSTPSVIDRLDVAARLDDVEVRREREHARDGARQLGDEVAGVRAGRLRRRRRTARDSPPPRARGRSTPRSRPRSRAATRCAPGRGRSRGGARRSSRRRGRSCRRRRRR